MSLVNLGLRVADWCLDRLGSVDGFEAGGVAFLAAGLGAARFGAGRAGAFRAAGRRAGIVRAAGAA